MLETMKRDLCTAKFYTNTSELPSFKLKFNEFNHNCATFLGNNDCRNIPKEAF